MGNKLTKHESSTKEDKQKTTAKEQMTDPNKEQKKSTFQKLIARFQIRPKKSESPTPKLQNGETKTLPPPKPPLRNQSERAQSKNFESTESLKQSQWTDVPLQVPYLSQSTKQENDNKNKPIPPPRKNKLKQQTSVDSVDKFEKAIMSFDQNLNSTSEKRVPVEEPIIVPSKVIEHVCDGTHQHVRNTVNGKVVDQIVPLRDKETKQNKSTTKHASTLSLPSYIEIKKKEDKRASSPTKSSKKKSSATSLPTDKKNKPTHTASEKIESYMTRCKSFGSILPHSKNDKLKVCDKNSDRESIDSWSGLEDWDMGIIEDDVIADMPKYSAKRGGKKNNNEDDRLAKAQTNIAKQKEELINSIQPATKEFDDVLSSMDQSYKKKQTSTEKSQLASTPESFDDIKVKKQEPYPFNQKIPKNVFENDAFFTNELILSEKKSHRDEVRKIDSKLAPLAVFDSDKESERDSVFDANINSIDEVDDKKIKAKGDISENTPTKQLHEDSQSVENSRPKLIPRRKSSSGHSKLLKYIKDDLNTATKPIENQTKQEEKIVSKDVVENTDTIEKIEEPEIVPLIKNVDRLWDDLINREDFKNTPLLEQESTISDLVETSSDDTRSTAKSAIEISHK